jgi:hypothetical protein
MPRPWTLVSSGTTVDLYSIWGKGTNDYVAVGGNPTVTTGNSGVAARWNGTSWTLTTNLVNFLSIFGNTAVGVYGAEGSESYWYGTTWSTREVLGAGYMRGTWDASPGTYAVGDNGRIAYTSETGIPGSWGALTSGTTNTLYAVWGSSTTNVFAVGAGGVILHNSSATVGGGGTWVKTVQSSSTLTGVWGSSANDVYVVGTNPAVVLHSKDGGTTWTTTPLFEQYPSGLNAITGISADDVYAVGTTDTTKGVIFHSYGDDVWTPEPQTPFAVDLFGVWEAGTGDTYAVGRGGTILHRVP